MTPPPPEPTARARRHVKGPLLAAAAVLAPALVIWGMLVRNQELDAAADARRRAEAIAGELATAVSTRALGIGRVAHRWEYSGPPRREEWENAVELLRRDVGGFESINWVDSTLDVRWCVPSTIARTSTGRILPRDPRRLEAIRRAREIDGPVVTRPIYSPRLGHRMVFVYAPVSYHGRYQGYISGIFALDSVITRIAHGHVASGFDFAVQDEGELVGETALPPVRRAALTSFDTAVLGSRWTVTVWPSTRAGHPYGSRMPETVLLFSCVLAAVVATAVALAQTARDAARRYATANERLEHENAARRIAEERAELASRSKSDFIARMSHELRTPLNSVIGFASVLRKNRGGRMTDDELSYLDRIRANGTHLLGLVNDILDVATVEAGHMRVRLEPVDLAALVRDTVSEMGGMPRSPGVALRTSVPRSVPPVDADAYKLRRIIGALVGNALKFTPEGSVEVALEVNPTTGLPAAIRVSDTGIGIAPERLETIFEPFEQGDNTIARKFGGTGLGLTIVRELCDLLGYTISVDSTPGAGTTFIVALAGAVASEVRTAV